MTIRARSATREARSSAATRATWHSILDVWSHRLQLSLMENGGAGSAGGGSIARAPMGEIAVRGLLNRLCPFFSLMLPCSDAAME